VRRANQVIEETAPWNVAKDKSRHAELAAILYDLLESLRITAILVSPAMPAKAQAIWQRIGQPGRVERASFARDLPWSETSRYLGLHAEAPLFPKSVPDDAGAPRP
jgi:methionyl-tRNA synthetase